MSDPYVYTDYADDELEIRTHEPGLAVIETRHHGRQDGDPVMVPANQLAEVVAAMYEAAGQPVPDLPVIHEHDQFSELASELADRFEGIDAATVAKAVLTWGWRRES